MNEKLYGIFEVAIGAIYGGKEAGDVIERMAELSDDEKKEVALAIRTYSLEFVPIEVRTRLSAEVRQLGLK